MFLRRVALLACTPVLSATSEDLQNEKGCDPSCVGECFAGTCLFSANLDDNLDNEDAPVGSQVPSLSAGALHGTLSERANLPAPPAPRAAKGVETHLHQITHRAGASNAALSGGGGAFDPKALGLDLRPDMGLPQSRGAVASGIVPSKAASEFAADLSVPTALQFGKRQSFLTSDQVMSQTAATVEKMKDALGQAQSTEETLQAENAELKTEIEQWRAAGAHVADREAKAVDALQQAGVSPKLLSQDTPATPAAAEPAELSYLSHATGPMQDFRSLASRRVPSSQSFWHAILGIATCVTLGAIGIALSGKVSKARPDTAEQGLEVAL